MGYVIAADFIIYVYFVEFLVQYIAIIKIKYKRNLCKQMEFLKKKICVY